ncbi:MAG TPA: ATP-grasp domain-containing protein [Candidatus Angelobacter sp.]|nr:ATP-grasp domain-containing protein [Candidatus Angelobacter sp.]
MNHFVFVESNTTGTGQIAIQKLLARGDQVTFLTRNPAKYPFLDLVGPEIKVKELDTNDLPGVLQAVHKIQAKQHVDAVLTFSDFYVSIVTELAAALGLPGLHPMAAQACRYKPATRRTLRDAGLLTPEFHLVVSKEEALELANKISYPCVLKPTCDSSSHGVRLVRGPREFLEHYNALHAWKENVRGQLLNGDVLVESLLEGPEFSVETVTLPDGVTRVVGITDKHLSRPPHFVELGHDFPSRADEAVQQSVVQAALQALAAVKFDFGPAHTEVRLTQRGPVVVEINPRLAGGMIPELVSYATGIDLLQAWMDLLLGYPLDLTPKRHGAASIRFLIAKESGQIRQVCGIEQALQIPSIREISVSRRAGATVRAPEDAYDRFGFVIASGSNASLVTRDLNRALDTIRIELDPCQRELRARSA